MGLSRILSLLIFTVIVVLEEVIAGFVQDNQNIFHEQFAQSAPISYQSFVNYDKFSSPARNSFDVHNSLTAKPKPVNQLSKTLFKAADFADRAAYNEEVENAHRIALAKRHNDTDAAYAEAYTEAVTAQRKAGSKSSYIPSYLRHHQFDSDAEYPDSRLSNRAESKSDNDYYQNRYEDVGTGEYNSNYNDGGNYEFTKSVGYVVPSDYEFNGNGVVHQQPEIVADQTEIQFAPALEPFDSSLRHQ